MAGALMKSLFLLLTIFVGSAAYAGGLPLLHLQPEVMDMGSVKEGEEARGTLFIRNNSGSVITITDVQTSCGCTVAEPKSRVLAPGAFTELEVTIDSTVKQGDVKKEVTVTDSAGHVARAIVKLKVTENPHLVREGRGLFDGKCAACHFDPVQGKTTGKAIYDAACAMCHGEDARGAYASALTGHDDATALQYLISHGTGSPQMPGFAIDAGGPLTQKQVFALSKWLLSLD
jgi:cytochrome c5